MTGFKRHRRSGAAVATFTVFEADLLRSLASQLIELLRNEAATGASQGDPLEDLAFSVWAWSPLWHDPAAVRREMGEVSVAERLHKFAAVVDGYAADAAQRARLADAVLEVMESHSRTLEELAAEGDPVFQRMVGEGHAARPRRDAAWFRARRDLFTAAIS